MNSPHNGPVTRKMFPFDDVIMHHVNYLSVTRGQIEKHSRGSCIITDQDEQWTKINHDYHSDGLLNMKWKRYNSLSTLWKKLHFNHDIWNFDRKYFLVSLDISAWSGREILSRYMYDDVIKWKHFTRYWPLCAGNSPDTADSPRKGQWRGALMCFVLFLSAHEQWVE